MKASMCTEKSSTIDTSTRKRGPMGLPDKPNNDLPDLPPAADVETTAPLIQYDHCSLHR